MQTSLKLKHILIFTILIIIASTSCKDEEPRPIVNPNGPDCVEDTIDLGKVDFTSLTDEWKNYTRDDKVFFVNAENEEIVFSTDLNISTSFHSLTDISIECKLGDLNQYIYASERWDQYFECEEKDLVLLYRLDIHPDISANSFVDRVLTVIETSDSNDTFNVIRQDLGYQPILENLNSEYALNEDFSEFHEDIELLGKSFSNVYEKSFSGRGYMDRLYINSDIGVVGFSDQSNELWVFDRIE